MKQHSYQKPGLEQPLTEDERFTAGSAVIEFQRSPGWYRLQQKLEDMREWHVRDLLAAPRREHLAMAEAAGVVRAIDEVYRFFEKIKDEAGKEK